MKTLRDVSIGDTVQVVKLHGDGPGQAPYHGYGHHQGRWRFIVRKVAPLGDPMEVTVRGYELSLRKADAEMIEVEINVRGGFPHMFRQRLAAVNRHRMQKERNTSMSIKIALAGNPNCGKTTLFNALTGSNQFVGNWPGVTVEKKEGRLKKHDDVIIMDLPGIYSLSPYTLEEVVARNYLITERPDAILNIIDGTNLERNLYLTTQLTELGIPVVIAINMMDVVRKNGDQINIERAVP